MKLSIITATILRPSLERTCRSVDEQSFTDWEHIIVSDQPGVAYVSKFDRRRRPMMCAVRHGGYGHECRNSVYPLATGDYILNLDDDDYYAHGALQEIADILEAMHPEWLLFPALVKGKRWLNIPPGKSLTVNCQFAHRNIPELRWPASKEYSADGDFVDSLVRRGKPLILDCAQELVIVEKSGMGRP